MDAKVEWVCIKFCVNQRKSATDTLAMIKWVFGKQIMTCTHGFEVACSVQSRLYSCWRWWPHWKAHKLHNTQHCCQSSASCSRRSTYNQSRACWWSGNWLRDMPTNVDSWTGYASCCPKICATILSVEHKVQHVAICREFHEALSDDPSHLFKAITGDESWIYGMILRQRKNPPTGKVQAQQDWKWCNKRKQSQEYAPCFLWFQGKIISSTQPYSKFHILL